MSENDRPRSLPLSTTLDHEELRLYHEVLPFTMQNWDLHDAEYDALVANLASTRTRRLSMKQHRRLSALMEIQFSVSPRPLMYDDASASVLRHPRSAPGGNGTAVDVMCAGLEQLEDVAAYFRTLPHGPWLLPGILQDFLLEFEPDIRWYCELLEEAERASTASYLSEADHVLARRLSCRLRAEALRAPRRIREAVLIHALRSPCPAVSAWGAEVVATRSLASTFTGGEDPALSFPR